MGQFAKPMGTDTTRYYWYPGDRREWIRAGLAVCAGLLAFGVTGLLSQSMLAAVTVGASVTAVLAGLNFGRRDLRGMRDFPELARAGAAPTDAVPAGAAPAGAAPVGAVSGRAVPGRAVPGRAVPGRAVSGRAGGAAREDEAVRRRARAARLVAVQHASRAAWRGTAQGVGGAAVALLIANLGAHGLLADWVLPIVPVLLGALAHQAGMVYERLAQVPPPELPPVPAKAAALRAAGTPVGVEPTERPKPAGGRATPGGPALRLTSYRGNPPTGPR